jgi:hypothetical protein
MLLDADILVDLIRGHGSAVAWFRNLPAVPKASGIAAMELIAGSRDANDLRSVQSFLAGFHLAWPTSIDMQHAYAALLPKRLSTGIGLLDCVVAATGHWSGGTARYL